MEDENPKGKVKFLKGGEFPPGRAIFLGISPPGGGEIVGGRNSWDTGTNKKAWPEPELCRFQRDRISNVFVSNKSSQ